MITSVSIQGNAVIANNENGVSNIEFVPVDLGDKTPAEAFAFGVAYAILENCGNFIEPPSTRDMVNHNAQTVVV